MGKITYHYMPSSYLPLSADTTLEVAIEEGGNHASVPPHSFWAPKDRGRVASQCYIEFRKLNELLISHYTDHARERFSWSFLSTLCASERASTAEKLATLNHTSLVGQRLFYYHRTALGLRLCPFDHLQLIIEDKAPSEMHIYFILTIQLLALLLDATFGLLTHFPSL